MTSLKQALGTIGAAVAVGATAFAAPASADVPASWEKRTSTCQSLSWYSVNPAYNNNATPTHGLTGHKHMWWTTGEIVNGWTPVYSAGQEDWHTGWVRGECLASGWFGSDGAVAY